MQCLQPEHDIDVGRAVANGLAFLAGHATSHTDHQGRVAILEFLPAAKLREDLFLGLLPYGAGIEQQDIRQGGILHDLETM